MPSKRSPKTVRISREHEEALNRLLATQDISFREWLERQIEKEARVRRPVTPVQTDILEEILELLREGAYTKTEKAAEHVVKPKRGRRQTSNPITNSFDF